MIKSPFKFLDSYTLQDRDIFFGRDLEISELYRKVFESRILLVYGVSGTGKSSLINCGLATRFEDSDWLPVTVRRGNNIIENLDSAIIKQAITPLNKNQNISEKLQSIYLDHFKPVFLIFDQFEELFIFGSLEEKTEFIGLLNEIVDSKVQCRIILIIREEFLAGITEFEYKLPKIFANRFRVEKMKRVNAISAIEGPCKVYYIEIEQGLPEELIDKLCPSGIDIELTYLQIYLDRIFHIAEAGKNTDEKLKFSKELVTKAGSVSNLLGQFLEEQIREFDDPETGMAILKSFVSLQGTKKQMNESGILDAVKAFGIDIEESDLLKHLTKFVDLRILMERNEAGYFELRHDALASKIYEKFTAIEKDIIEVQHFIESEYSVYEKRGKLLTPDDLNYISLYETKLFLNKARESFILKSKNEIFRVKKRKRNTAIVTALLAILILSGFTIWALLEKSMAFKEKEAANLNYLKAKANNLNYISQKVEEYDPTIALGIAKYAVDLDSLNPSLRENLSKIYYDNNFYTILQKEQKFIMSADISPDGKTFITGSNDDTARLYDLDGKILQKFVGHKSRINSIKFSFDGQKVLTGSDDSTARFWDLQGNALRIFRVNKGGVYSVAFSPDNKSIIAGTDDGAYLWDLTGRLVNIFKGHKNEVSAVAFSPKGSKILTGSVDSTAILWNIDGKLLKVFKGHNDIVNSVIFSPDGEKVLTCSDDRTARIWDLMGKELQIFKGHSDYLVSAVFSGDGKYILTGSFDRTARLWDLKGNVLQVFHGHEDGINQALFFPNDNNIFTVSYDKTVRIWDLEGIRSILLKNHSDWVSTVAFSSDGKYILTGSDDKTACLWDLQGNLLKIYKGHKNYINSLAFSPDGKKFITGSSDSTAILWDVKGLMLKVLKSPEGEITAVAMSPDGEKLITGTADSLRLYDYQGNLLKRFKNSGGQLFSMVFSPDSKSFLTGSYDSIARLRNLEGNVLHIYKGHENQIHSVAFSPDGRNLLTGSCDGTGRLWDLQGNLIQVFRGHTGHVHAVAFSPDGKFILTGSMDKTARFWDLDGTLLQVLSGYGYMINCVAISPDGKYILTGSDDMTARLRKIKKSLKEFMLENSFQELSVKQKIKYGILELSDVVKLQDKKSLEEAGEYYFDEINKTSKNYRAEYLKNALTVYNKLISNKYDTAFISRKDSIVRLQNSLTYGSYK
jgi:WD40 repeat protein